MSSKLEEPSFLSMNVERFFKTSRKSGEICRRSDINWKVQILHTQQLHLVILEYFIISCSTRGGLRLSRCRLLTRQIRLLQVSLVLLVL